jgi:hypothetical protein
MHVMQNGWLLLASDPFPSSTKADLWVHQTRTR